MTVAPTSASLSLGATQQFQAIVTGSSNTKVRWEVNGVPGGSASAGTISTNGPATAVYAAPAILPSPASVTVTAVSEADSTASASAIVNLSDSIVVTVLPAATSVPTGGAQVFTASVTGSGSVPNGVS